MERELWCLVRGALRRLPRWWPRNASYSNTEILAVLLWAALHNRPICWACQRSSWPVQAWRRRLPDQSTMSRRLREDRLIDDLRTLIDRLQRSIDTRAEAFIVDGKPLPVSNISGDPDAARGWGAGIYARGYKLHAVIDSARRLIDFEVRPLNTPESVVAAEMVARAPRADVLLADASYDSNALYRACELKGTQLLAPRRRPFTGLGWVRGGHAASRVRSIELLEKPDSPWHDRHHRARLAVERYFGALATPATGLYVLPPWTRRIHRVRAWVAAKLTIHAARMARLAA